MPQKLPKLQLGLGIATLVSLILTLWKKWSKKPITSPKILLSKYNKYRKYIEAQARHETGNYTSLSYDLDNNLFGMKNAIKRKQLGVKKEDRPYRVYKNNAESIADFLIYLDYVNFPTDLQTLQEYVQELKFRSYFEDSEFNYFRGVNQFYQQLN